MAADSISLRILCGTLRRLLLASAAFGLLLATSASAATRYHIVDLGFDAVAQSVDAAGDVAGSPDYYHAGIFRNGSWQMMPAGEQVTSINASGDAVGVATYIDRHGRGYFYPAGGGDPVRLEPPFKMNEPMRVAGINAGGDVLGHIYLASNSHSRCVLWHDLMPGMLKTPGSICWAAGLNDAGQLLGTANISGKSSQSENYQAFIWTQGHVQYLGTLGGHRSFAGGINAQGHAAVTAETHNRRKNAPHRAAFWDGDSLHDLGTFDGAGDSAASGINGLDEIVGNAHDADGAQHPFVWRGAGLVALEPLVDGADGWRLGGATAINDAGAITGLGSYQGSNHAYLLVPYED